MPADTVIRCPILQAWIVLLLVIGCSPGSRLADADDIREAVFRYQFEHCYGRTLAVYALTIDGHDPSDAFLQRFHGHQPPVTKPSGGRGGAVFEVSRLIWRSPTAVDIEGACGVYTGMEGGTFRVVRHGPRWVVTGHHYTWAGE